MNIKFKIINIIFISGSVFYSIPTTVQAKQVQSIDSIKNSVSRFLKAKLNNDDFSINTIDKRLRLKKCSKTIISKFPTYSKQLGRTTVEVSCSDKKSWKILVGVNIKKYLNTLSAKNSLPVGNLVKRDDIIVKRTEVSRLRNGYFTHPSQILNMVVRRPIHAGQAFSSSLLKPKQLVTRGDDVLILAKTKNLRIKVKGTALMNGFLGQKIKVRNTKSKRVFQAVVISNGLVEVNM